MCVKMVKCFMDNFSLHTAPIPDNTKCPQLGKFGVSRVALEGKILKSHKDCDEHSSSLSLGCSNSPSTMQFRHCHHKAGISQGTNVNSLLFS